MALKGWKGSGGASSVVRGEREQGTSLLPSARPEMRIHDIALSQLVPNPDQPRQVFDDAELDSLARSIQERGLLQPIVVKPQPDGHSFMIVAGERRFRACQRLGLPTIRAVWSSSDDTALDALLENCQRSNLLPLELADSLAALLEHSRLTNRDAGALLGYREEQISRLLKLRSLPDSLRGDYFATRPDLSLNALYEITMARDPDTQSQMWAAARAGASVADLRQIRQSPPGSGAGQASTTGIEGVPPDDPNGPQNGSGAATPNPVPAGAPVRMMAPSAHGVAARSIKTAQKQIEKLHGLGPLPESQRDSLRALRDAISHLIGEG